MKDFLKSVNLMFIMFFLAIVSSIGICMTINMSFTFREIVGCSIISLGLSVFGTLMTGGI